MYVVALALVRNQAQLPDHLRPGIHCQRLTQHAAQLEPASAHPTHILEEEEKLARDVTSRKITILSRGGAGLLAKQQLQQVSMRAIHGQLVKGR